MDIILGILFFVLIAASVAAAVFLFLRARKTKNQKRKIAAVISLGVAAVFFVMFIFIPFGFIQVETGEIAVVKVWGEAKEVRTSGLHFRNIISTKYEIYDIKTQQMDIDNEVYTKDAQPLSIELALQYSIMADKAIEISTTYGTMEVLAQRIEKVAIEKSKVILSAKTAMELIETRAAISPDVYAEIKTIETQYFIKVENVVVVDMAFSAAFEKAVEDKMVAQQEVIKAEAEKEKAIIKAEQDLAVAMLAAEQALAQAQGQADAQIAIAMGEAEALKLKSLEVARMLGFKVVELTEDKEIDVLDNGGEVIGTQTVTVVSGYEIDFANSDPALDKTLISEYLKYIAYLESWNGELPSVITDAGGSIIIPMP